jgi:hypothetical protein
MSRLPRDIFDNETGFEVCLFGSGFKYDEGGLIKGNVEKIQFMTEAGDAFVTVTDFNLGSEYQRPPHRRDGRGRTAEQVARA